MVKRRQLNEIEKQTVIQQQLSEDGSLRCFISGNIITHDDDVEFDHIQPYSKDGETEITNIRVVLKSFNRRKSDQSLYDVRDNLRLEQLFDEKKNNIRLQDILGLKEIHRVSTHSTVSKNTLTVTDGSDSRSFPLLTDDILQVPYFYGRIPIRWIENDDQEGLQPRVIDFKRLIAIRDHLKSHPQLAPSIGRLMGHHLKLFDGQHKLAAQVLNGRAEVDLKIYVSPDEPNSARRLFDLLMMTNLEAHSKLKQIPFYTSTLLDRLSVIYKEFLDEFISTKTPEQHTEENFVSFLIVSKGFTSQSAKEMLRSAIKSAALDGSPLSNYVAEASKDSSFPITVDLLEKTIFRSTLFLEPSNARFTSDMDHRSSEAANFSIVANLLVLQTGIGNWVPHTKGRSLTNEQLRARRIWHKGSVLTWSPYLKSLLRYGLQCLTNDDNEKMLYRAPLSEQNTKVIETCLKRLFGHPFWDDPSPEIDSLLVSAKRQDDLFKKKGLTELYVIQGAQ